MHAKLFFFENKTRPNKPLGHARVKENKREENFHTTFSRPPLPGTFHDPGLPRLEFGVGSAGRGRSGPDDEAGGGGGGCGGGAPADLTGRVDVFIPDLVADRFVSLLVLVLLLLPVLCELAEREKKGRDWGSMAEVGSWMLGLGLWLW